VRPIIFQPIRADRRTTNLIWSAARVRSYYAQSIASNIDPKIPIQNIQYQSVQIHFSLSKTECPQLSLNSVSIAIQNVTKYLGNHLNKRLTRTQHTKRKKIIRHTPTSPSSFTVSFNKNKILIYKTIITPLWSYGI